MNLPEKLKFSYLLIFLFSINIAFAQDIECGFQFTPENQRYYNSIKDDIELLEQQFLNKQLESRSSTALSSVAIKAHIIRQTDGSGGFTATELNNAIAEMNSIYVNAGLEFYICDSINYIDSDDYYDFETNDESALFAAHSVADIMNIFFTDAIISSSSGGSLCGYARFPGGAITENVLMANSCASNGSTLSHEVGHFFALSHTHGNSNVVGSTEELVNGSNCDTTGDFICDTPADPQLGYTNVNSSCLYTGISQDANLDFYQPEPLNIMSYSRKVCRTLFSPNQYARINAIYNLSRRNLACPSFSVNFSADEKESCQANFTVNFTDYSVGATSWSWDVDGDDIADYTTQNISHTYNTLGSYDVVLTVSNGTDYLTKVKNEYIKVGSDAINTPTIILSLTLDDWPVETSWQFEDGNGTVLYSGGPYVEGVDDFTTKTESFAILPNTCYSFIINDTYGDGICCSSGNGNYQLKDSNNNLLASSNGNYGFSNNNNFLSDSVLGVNDFNTDSILLYPNPSSNIITISSKLLPDSYVIYNTLGQVLRKSQVNSNTDTDLSINVETLNDGMYFIKLTKDNSSQVLSFIKN